MPAKTNRLPAITGLRITRLVAFILLLAATAPLRAADDKVQDLKQEINRLRDRVEILESRLQRVLQQVSREDGSISDDSGAENNAGTGGDTVVTPVTAAALDPPPGPDVSIGGRIKFDAIYNSRSVGGPGGSNRADQAFSPAAIPLEGAGEHDQTSYSARDSRLWVTAHTPTPVGDIAAYVEMDFVGGGTGNEKVSNSYTPRLRHAYAGYGGLTVGQTYTSFMNVSAFPEINDANGPPSILNVRQPLLRYRHAFDRGGVLLSMEQPETTLTANSGRIAPDDDRVPDIIGKLEFGGLRGNWSVAAMLRQIRIDGYGDDDISDSAWGGAVSASGRLYLNRRDNLRFTLAYGNALGRYLSYNSFDDGIVDAGGNIELTPVAGGFVSYQHWWSETLRSSFTAGYARADPHRIVRPEEMTESFYSTHINLLWSPTLKATLGIEWLHGHREQEDGRSGDLDRIQFTSTYKF